MTLPYDVTRCANDSCETRHDCLRFTAPLRPDGLQSACRFMPDQDGNCASRIEVEGVTCG